MTERLRAPGRRVGPSVLSPGLPLLAWLLSLVILSCDAPAPCLTGPSCQAALDQDGDRWVACPGGVTDPSAAGCDCDDLSAERHPGAEERCDGVDDDCDLLLDEALPERAYFTPDLDGDGYAGALAETTVACGRPPGSAEHKGDCDDEDDRFHPEAGEVCDTEDNDCDGRIDEGELNVGWWPDRDGDGQGDDDARPTLSCTRPTSPPGVHWSLDDHDCDDGEPFGEGIVFRGAPERCDLKDNDCDRRVDEGCECEIYVIDGDGDGYGATLAPPETLPDCGGGTMAAVCRSCAGPPSGYSRRPGDCDDGDPLTYPGAEERCDLAIDRDCDGETGPVDVDGDGVSACDTCEAPARCGDCDDADPARVPGRREVCDGKDNDCDLYVDEEGPVSTWLYDGDLDLYGDRFNVALLPICAARGWTQTTGDCDDAWASSHPGAEERCTGRDDDCDGVIDEAQPEGTYRGDQDRDGFGCSPERASCAQISTCPEDGSFIEGEVDCDDAASLIYPGAEEILCDGVDQDCSCASDPTCLSSPLASGDDGDWDGDGWSACDGDGPGGSGVEGATSCDPLSSSSFPEAPERCDGIDQDCDGRIDEEAQGLIYYFVDLDGDLCGTDSALHNLALCPGVSPPEGYVCHAGDDDEEDPGSTGICDPSGPCSDPIGGAEATPTPTYVEVCATTPPEGSVCVPAGPSLMGQEDSSSGGGADERPLHVVTVPELHIERYEVSAQDFADFLNAEGNLSPEGETRMELTFSSAPVAQDLLTGSLEPKPGLAQHPAVAVTWYGARDYCAWRGGALPSEAAWEKSAGGSCWINDPSSDGCQQYDRRIYPWGDALPAPTEDACAYANHCAGWSSGDDVCDPEDFCMEALGGTRTAPVDADYSAGDSPYGVSQLAGNVYEWVADCYHPSYADTPRDGSAAECPEEAPPPGDGVRGAPSAESCAAPHVSRVARGGAFNLSRANLRVTHRQPACADQAFNNVGFRCAYAP